jgi:hypothetical protein
MNGHRIRQAVVAATLMFSMATSLRAALNSATPWQPATLDDVRTKLSAWLDEAKADSDTRAKVLKAWSTGNADNLLDRLAESFAQVEPRAQSLVQVCSRPHVPGALAKQDWLTDPKTPPFLARNMRLYYGRWMTQWSMFSSAQPMIAGLEPGDVVDPAGLLFYQAVVHHRLLQPEEGLHAIRQLLAAEEQCPRRYVAVAKLMEQDLKALKEDTLDHIARRMDDIRRRLDLGQGGREVRGVQDGVIKSLDKLIKQIEDQQQQLEQQMAMGSGGKQSSSPAPDSRILGGKGPGDVVKRDIGKKSGWGNISPKQRDEAIQQIGRDFPPHYRELIEQYFRQLANEGTE